MSRPLKVGDRVAATARVIGDIDYEGEYLIRIEVGKRRTVYVSPDALTLIEPAEPPVGSVVVKDDRAWTRASSGNEFPWCSPGSLVAYRWSNLSDGTIIHTPGGDA